MRRSDFISLTTRTHGPIDVRPEEISLIRLPSLRFYLTFRGNGSLITLKNGKTLHIKEEPHEVRRLIREAMDGVAVRDSMDSKGV